MSLHNDKFLKESNRKCKKESTLKKNWKEKCAKRTEYCVTVMGIQS